MMMIQVLLYQYSTVLVLVLAVLHEYLLVKYKYEHASK